MARVLAMTIVAAVLAGWFVAYNEMPTHATDSNEKKENDTRMLQSGIMKLQTQLDAHRQTRFAEPRDPDSPFKQRENANWSSIEADNGSVYRVDMNSIRRSSDGRNAEIVVYIAQGDKYNPANLTRFMFACAEHQFMDERSFGTWIYAPPRSVSRQIERAACGQ